MGWPLWLLLAVLATLALLLLTLHLFRFRYHYAYAFPYSREGAVSLSFLAWKKEIRLEVEEEDEGGSGAEPEAAEGAVAGKPQPGQAGFLAVPFRERLATWRGRLKAAALKWALDLPVWGHLADYALRTGIRALRLAGPSLERLHVGSADVLNLGRFAAFWSTLTGMAPFLAGPVEYGFNERPFSLRFRISGGCTAMGFLLFALALLLTLPWLRLFARFRHCWRNPRLSLWQRKLVAAVS